MNLAIIQGRPVVKSNDGEFVDPKAHPTHWALAVADRVLKTSPNPHVATASTIDEARGHGTTLERKLIAAAKSVDMYNASMIQRVADLAVVITSINRKV